MKAHVQAAESARKHVTWISACGRIPTTGNASGAEIVLRPALMGHFAERKERLKKMKNIVWRVSFALAGAVLGYIYYALVGCNSGG